MIEKISVSLKKSSEIGLRHNSREDVRSLAKICNILIQKVNELTDEINRLNQNNDE